MDIVTNGLQAGSAHARDMLLPSIQQLYGASLPPFFIALICTACILLGGLCFVFVRQIKYVLHNTPSHLVTRTLLMNGAYPIIGVAALVSLLVPQALVFCESVCHLTYSMTVYQFFGLIVSCAGGESGLIKATASQEVFTMRTPPCCCCCIFMRPTVLTKRCLRRLRIMILQVPIVQGALLFSLNIIHTSNAQLYEFVALSTLPIMVSSVLTGEWAITILVNMLQPFYGELKLKIKFIIIQLLLLAFKLQVIIGVEILKGMTIENPGFPVTPRVALNAILQVVILAEMLLMAWWASFLYRNPQKMSAIEPVSENA